MFGYSRGHAVWLGHPDLVLLCVEWLVLRLPLRTGQGRHDVGSRGSGGTQGTGRFEETITRHSDPRGRGVEGEEHQLKAERATGAVAGMEH